MPNIAGVGNGTQNNFFSNQLRHQDYRGWLARIDHRISSSQSIFGKYYHSFNPEDRQDWAGIVNGFPITQGFEFRTNDGGNIDYTNAINSNLVFDIRVSLNRFVQERGRRNSSIRPSSDSRGVARRDARLPVLPAHHDQKSRRHAADQIDARLDAIGLERRPHPAVLHGFGATDHDAGCR